MGLVGCAEDNESATREQASKAGGEVKSTAPPVSSMEEYAKQNPGMGGAATSSKGPQTKKK
jgi:hypothetical protein